MKLIGVLLAWLFAFAANADLIEQVSGANRTEREIRWLWKYVGEFTRACGKNDCKDAEVRAVLDKLNTAMPLAPQLSTSAWGQRLKFVSEKDNPDLFTSAANEAHRIAVT